MNNITILFNELPMTVAAEDMPPIGEQSPVPFFDRWLEYVNADQEETVEPVIPDFMRQALIAKGFTDAQIDQMRISNVSINSDLDLRTGNECCASPQLNEDGSCDACGACCQNEDRSHNGGCRSCGDPCL